MTSPLARSMRCIWLMSAWSNRGAPGPAGVSGETRAIAGVAPKRQCTRVSIPIGYDIHGRRGGVRAWARRLQQVLRPDAEQRGTSMPCVTGSAIRRYGQSLAVLKPDGAVLSTRFLISDFGNFRSLSLKAMFSNTVMCGYSA